MAPKKYKIQIKLYQVKKKNTILESWAKVARSRIQQLRPD